MNDDAAKTWRDVAKPLPLTLGALIAALSTTLQLNSTYDGFFGDAIGTIAAGGLILMNGLLTAGLMVLLAKAFKPRNVWLYATTVALSFQTILATDLAVEPLAGTDQVGQGQKANIASFHSSLEKFFSERIDDPVEDAKRGEIAKVEKAYPAATDLPKLRADLDRNLRTDSDVDATERKTVLDQVDGLIADTKLSHSDKILDIALAVYATVGRDPIEDLAAGK